MLHEYVAVFSYFQKISFLQVFKTLFALATTELDGGNVGCSKILLLYLRGIILKYQLKLRGNQ